MSFSVEQLVDCDGSQDTVKLVQLTAHNVLLYRLIVAAMLTVVCLVDGHILLSSTSQKQ